MEYREKQFSVVHDIYGSWKWTVEWGDGRRKLGTAYSRPVAIKAAERAIDRALAPKKIKRRERKPRLMEDRLTAEQCDELAKALSQDAAALPQGEREELLDLVEAYRTLAKVKRIVASKLN